MCGRPSTTIGFERLYNPLARLDRPLFISALTGSVPAEPDEYMRGHVPGAVNLPQAELATRLAEVPRDRTIFVICQGGVRSLRSTQFLRQMQIGLVASVRGGTEAGVRPARRSPSVRANLPT